MSRTRIAITGIGGLCALGANADEIWNGMRDGHCGIGEIDGIKIEGLKTKIGGQIDQIPDNFLERRQLVTMDRFSVLAALAADEAIKQARIEVTSENETRIGSIIGTGIYGCESVDDGYLAILVNGKRSANVFTVPRSMPGAPSGQVSMTFGLKGPVFGVTSACSSSNHAIAAAADAIRLGRADVMITGGTDAPLTFGVLKAWEALRILAPTASRPFSANREGLVLGEGAGALVLESFEHAEARGAPILAELAGSGLSGDAADIVAPSHDGPVSAMRACLLDAGLNAEDVDYINAHGTATKVNDKLETEVIRDVLGAHADQVSVSSTKSMHAHCLGASGAIEAIACIKAIQNNIAPPTIGYDEPDPDCNLDVTANVAKEREINVALSNAFAFGGTNAVLAFKGV